MSKFPTDAAHLPGLMHLCAFAFRACNQSLSSLPKNMRGSVRGSLILGTDSVTHSIKSDEPEKEEEKDDGPPTVGGISIAPTPTQVNPNDSYW
eukprot:1180145-Prorocentrum_minimum.AAC.5